MRPHRANFPFYVNLRQSQSHTGLEPQAMFLRFPEKKSLHQCKPGTILKHNSISLISLLTYCSKLWYFSYYFMPRAIERLMLQVKQTV